MNVHKIFSVIFVLLCVFGYSCKRHPIDSKIESSICEKKMEIKDPNAYNKECITCILSIEKKGDLAKQVLITVTFKNKMDFSIPIEKRNLFISLKNTSGEMDYSAFEVSKDGKEVEYQGNVVKRRTDAAKFPDDYYVLLPNCEYVTTINLSKYYNLRKEGLYSIKYHAWNYLTFFFKKSYAFEIESDVIKFEN